MRENAIGYFFGRGLLGVILLVVSATFTLADDPVDVAKLVDSVGQRAIESENIVGLCIGIAKGGQVLHTQSFGMADVELEVKTSTKTVFRIGSITKQFTAVAILILVEQGKISLEDPISKYLPDYPEHASAVTVRQLLQHTPGIKEITQLPVHRQENTKMVPQSEVVDRFKDLPLDFPPGTKFKYCNSGYILLAEIVDKASGEKFRDFVTANVFEPAKLESTFCGSHMQVIPNRASGYTNWGNVLRNAPYLNLQQTSGAGNIVSTVEDLLRWQIALNNHQVITPDSLKLMRTDGKLTNGKSVPYGFGVFLRTQHGQRSIRHGGGIQGFRADLAYYPESGYTIAILSNSGHANAARISDRIAKPLLSALNGAPAEDTPKTKDQ